MLENTKRRRRFHPLRNLRRIFRRRTLAHADTIRPIVQQHHHHHYHQHSAHQNRDQQQFTDLNSVSTIRSLSSQSIDEVLTASSQQKIYQQSDYLNNKINSTGKLTSRKRSPFSVKDKRKYQHQQLQHHKQQQSQEQEHYYIDESSLNTSNSDLKREMTDYQRSLSEGRLIDR